MKIDVNTYIPLLTQIRDVVEEHMKTSKGESYMKTHDGVRIYVNDKGDYFSFEIKEINFEVAFTFYNSKDDLRIYKDSLLYDDKIEMLLLDAIEISLYEIEPMLKEINDIRTEKINKLFEAFILRRDLMKNNTKEEIKEVACLQEKIYI